MNSPIDNSGLDATISTLCERLLAARGPQGHWKGRLSSSALSTATAVFALAVVDRGKYSPLIDRGLRWLCENQNPDGGWGDTVQSPGNLSTTMLCYSALAVPECPPACRRSVENAESWLHRTVGNLEPEWLAKAVEDQYGKDRTFSVPILTMCALSGRLGAGAQAWRLVRPLPFELAVLPPRFYKWLRLPVVSYALPALIAIGQARYEHLKPGNPLTRVTRHLSRERSLTVLRCLQPQNGGFLEAAPLTSFVVMSLAAAGRRDHEVVTRGTEFLVASIREDGSWPIDTNLATWVTTLSINALSPYGSEVVDPVRDLLADWLLSCQHKDVHPYTQAEPGGWAWSNLPGAVPDADDTAGALIALHVLSPGWHGQTRLPVGFRPGKPEDNQHRQTSWAVPPGHKPESAIAVAVSAGITWLLGLQNRDGGIPTFCRGWTKLPFDKSTPDITAHALGAMGTWLDALAGPLRERTEKTMRRALQYLEDVQRPDGSWIPLWFGNQAAPNQENPVYGTSRALTHLSRMPESYRARIDSMCKQGVQWLLSAQNADGGWGGAVLVASSIEETALAVDALAAVSPQSSREAIRRGTDWLIQRTDQGRSTPASPIGLYFARLWYFEELYPLLFALSALSKVRNLSVGS